MSEQRKSFLINLGVGAAIAVLAYLFAASVEAEGGIVQKLCDAFFVAGVMITGSAGLGFVRNQGLFDIFSYSFRGLFGVRIPPWVQDGDKRQSFAEYKEKKKAKRKAPTGALLAGLCYLGASLLMLVIYYV